MGAAVVDTRWEAVSGVAIGRWPGAGDGLLTP
jgi:hypothetical protein